MDATMVARVCFDFVEPAQEECSLVIGLPMYGTFELSTFFPRSSLARVHARVHPMNVNYASVRTARQLSFYSFYLSLINRIPCILYIYVYIRACIYAYSLRCNLEITIARHSRPYVTMRRRAIPTWCQRRFPHAKHVKSLAEDKKPGIERVSLPALSETPRSEIYGARSARRI